MVDHDEVSSSDITSESSRDDNATKTAEINWKTLDDLKMLSENGLKRQKYR